MWPEYWSELNGITIKQRLLIVGKNLHIVNYNFVFLKFYIPDFICFDKIIVELKALSAITTEHHAQVLNCMKAARLNLGLIMNFGKRSFEHKRIIKEN